ncbi:MAG TPA: hypothetical protein VN222_14120 [Novosphingobium sp.]|nr:hypothetical protein [Novosphingobium sp.]
MVIRTRIASSRSVALLSGWLGLFALFSSVSVGLHTIGTFLIH